MATITIPDELIPGDYELTGEYRQAVSGEFYAFPTTPYGTFEVRKSLGNFDPDKTVQMYLILRKKTKRYITVEVDESVGAEVDYLRSATRFAGHKIVKDWRE